MSVDENWQMRADPELAAGWTPAELGSVLVHHVCHLLRTHGERAQAAGVSPEEALTWVRAADAEINDDLVPAGLELPGRPILPRDLGAQDGLLAEQYFEAIRPRPDPRTPGAKGGPAAGTTDRSGRGKDGEAAGGWLDCGSGADGVPRPGERRPGGTSPPDPPDGAGGLPAWQAELLRRQVAQDVVAHAKQPGTARAIRVEED